MMKMWVNVWENNVKFAVLVDNSASEAYSNFCGMTVNKAENDVWIDFPWESFWNKGHTMKVGFMFGSVCARYCQRSS